MEPFEIDDGDILEFIKEGELTTLERGLQLKDNLHYRLAGAVSSLDWLGQGVPYNLIRPGITNNWQKGKIQIRFQFMFIPDQPDQDE